MALSVKLRDFPPHVPSGGGRTEDHNGGSARLIDAGHRFPGQHVLETGIITEYHFGRSARGGILPIDVPQPRNDNRLAEIEIDERVGSLAVRCVFAQRVVIEDMLDLEHLAGIHLGALHDLGDGEEDQRRELGGFGVLAFDSAMPTRRAIARMHAVAGPPAKHEFLLLNQRVAPVRRTSA